MAFRATDGGHFRNRCACGWTDGQEFAGHVEYELSGREDRDDQRARDG